MILSFVTDDGHKAEIDMEVFVQDKDSGHYSKYEVTQLMIERRLGMVREASSWMYGDELPIHWNYYVSEQQAKDKKKIIELNGPDRKTFMPKTIIKN